MFGLHCQERTIIRPCGRWTAGAGLVLRVLLSTRPGGPGLQPWYQRALLLFWLGRTRSFASASSHGGTQCGTCRVALSTAYCHKPTRCAHTSRCAWHWWRTQSERAHRTGSQHGACPDAGGRPSVGEAPSNILPKLDERNQAPVVWLHGAWTVATPLPRPTCTHFHRTHSSPQRAPHPTPPWQGTIPTQYGELTAVTTMMLNDVRRTTVPPQPDPSPPGARAARTTAVANRSRLSLTDALTSTCPTSPRRDPLRIN